MSFKSEFESRERESRSLIRQVAVSSKSEVRQFWTIVTEPDLSYIHSDSRWRHFYLVIRTKAQWEFSPKPRSWNPLTYLLTCLLIYCVVCHQANDVLSVVSDWKGRSHGREKVACQHGGQRRSHSGVLHVSSAEKCWASTAWSQWKSKLNFKKISIDYSVRNDEVAAWALQEIQGKNEWRDGSSNVLWEQILTLPMWRSAREGAGWKSICIMCAELRHW